MLRVEALQPASGLSARHLRFGPLRRGRRSARRGSAGAAPTLSCSPRAARLRTRARPRAWRSAGSPSASGRSRSRLRFDERRHPVEVRLADGFRGRDRVQPPRRPRAGRRARCSVLVEEVVAPVDRRAHRLLPRGQVGRAAVEQRQPVLEPAASAPPARATSPGPRRAPAPAATRRARRRSRSRRGRGARRAKPGVDRAGAGGEEVYGRSASGVPELSGYRQRRHRVVVLAREAEQRRGSSPGP